MMAWQFGKSEEPPRPVDRLILVEQPDIDDNRRRLAARRLEKRTQRRESEADELTTRILSYMRTMEQGTRLEDIAAKIGTHCKAVRECVKQAKREGWIVEAAYRSHCLIRLGETTR